MMHRTNRGCETSKNPSKVQPPEICAAMRGTGIADVAVLGSTPLMQLTVMVDATACSFLERGSGISRQRLQLDPADRDLARADVQAQPPPGLKVRKDLRRFGGAPPLPDHGSVEVVHRNAPHLLRLL